MKQTPNNWRAIEASTTRALRMEAANRAAYARQEEAQPHVAFWERDEHALRERETRLTHRDCTNYPRKLARAYAVVALAQQKGISVPEARRALPHSESPLYTTPRHALAKPPREA